MAELDIGLRAKINEFKHKFGITDSIGIDKVFEYFSNYVIISNVLQSEWEDINKISTKSARGIDGIGIIVNDRLIADESDLEKIGENEKLTVKLVFIQATNQSSFDTQKFSSFVDSVVSFLLGDLRIDPFYDIYQKIFDEEGDFIDNLNDTPTVSLYFTSAKTEHAIEEALINEQKNKITNRAELHNKIKLDNIYFLQKDELKGMYDEIPKYDTVTIKFFRNTRLTEKEKVRMSLLGVIKFEDLKELILTKGGNLKEKIFIENPRSFLSSTDVNNSIKETLNNEKYKPYFVYLNNGLSILCESIKPAPVGENKFILKYPRIINGCQTTHILFNAFKEKEDLSNTEIVVKVIATDDEELKKQIIFAANNQNSISKDLKSLNGYHKKIEEFFNGFSGKRLYYERLRGQYPNISPPYKKINIENMAKVYISVFLEEPHKMKSNAIKKIDEYQGDRRIFDSYNNDENEIKKYYFCALLYYWFNKFLVYDIIKLKSKTMDMHLLMTCNLLLEKSNINTIDGKIRYLLKEDKAKRLFTEATHFMDNQRYLFKRRGFYSGPKTKQLIEAIIGRKLYS